MQRELDRSIGRTEVASLRHQIVTSTPPMGLPIPAWAGFVPQVARYAGMSYACSAMDDQWPLRATHRLDRQQLARHDHARYVTASAPWRATEEYRGDMQVDRRGTREEARSMRSLLM